MARKKRKKRNGNTLTRHHIRPSSRKGANYGKNIAMIKDKKHKAYHIMFSNMTPDEIIVHLVEEFGKWRVTECKKCIFNKTCPKEKINEEEKNG